MDVRLKGWMTRAAAVDSPPTPNETLTMPQTLSPAPRRARRRISGGIAALLVAAVVGCGGDSSTGPRNADPTDPTGLYSLRQVGKDAIPAQIFRGQLRGIPAIMTIGITG